MNLYDSLVEAIVVLGRGDVRIDGCLSSPGHVVD